MDKDDKGVILHAASYQAVCPRCGARRLVSELPPALECGCGAVIELADPRHNYGDDGEPVPPGTPMVASYRWRCPECGRTHFEFRARTSVRCSKCGAAFRVEALEHAPRRLF